MEIEEFKIHAKKENNDVYEIAKNNKEWPDFFYSCNLFLNKDDNFDLEVFKEYKETENSFNLKKRDFKMIPFNNFEHNHLLAGAIYALGIKKEISEECFYHYYLSKKDIVIFSIIIGYCISIKGSCQDSISKTLKTNLLENDSFLVKIGSIMGLGFLYAKTGNSEIIEILKKECSRNSVFISERNKNHRLYYDEFYRIFSTFSLCLVFNEKKRFFSMKDSFCELILNGILFAGTKNQMVYKELKRNDDSKLEEIFYSSFFCELILLKKSSLEILNNVDINIENIVDIFKLSGLIFYIAFYELFYNKNKENITEKLLKLCLDVEQKILVNYDFKILFDYILITLSLINNGTCNLDILRILRRQIKKTERSKFLGKNDFFCISSAKDESTFGPFFGEILKFKMCLGILCAGKGKFYIKEGKNAILNIICTFYINFPLTANDQDYFNILRYFLCFNLEKKNEKESDKKYDFDFIIDFDKLDFLNQKATLDILCDYFEKNDNYIDFECYKKLAVVFNTK
ncbi:Anaphase-promoting complex subunit 1 [Gurleya vavrai]